MICFFREIFFISVSLTDDGNSCLYGRALMKIYAISAVFKLIFNFWGR